MMGIDPLRQREMLEEGLDAILALLDGSEPVNRQTDWFTLRDARLHLRPYQPDGIEVAIAAQVSPAGPRAAGRFGCSLLSLGATTTGGFDVLGAHWKTMEDRAEDFGQTVDRSRWRLVGPMHLADTEAQARKDVEYGLAEWVDYFQRVAALPLVPPGTDGADLADALIATGMAVIGTPDQAVAQLQRLQDQSGGFGTYLFMAHEWADREATLKSYELFAHDVMPLFQGSAATTVASRDWAAGNREQFMNGAIGAVMKAITEHQAERDAKATSA
jgi:limonene 1,2-monooxygenase